MEVNCRVLPKKRLTSVGVICELAKTRSQEHYLYGVQSKAILDLDLGLAKSGDAALSQSDDIELEKRLLSAIELDLIEFPAQFQKDKVAVQQGILNLKEKIKRLQVMADNVQKYDLKTYRNCVLDVENTITDLHNNNQLRLGKLKFDHMDIVAEIPETSELLKEETKFPQRRQPQLNVVSRIRKYNQDQQNSCDYKEIRAFDRFLRARGGHTGGWNDEQHSIYLSLRAKYKSNLNRIEEAFKEIIPGKVVIGLTFTSCLTGFFLFLVN